MMLRSYAHALKKSVSLPIFRSRNRHKEKFECPICAYAGPFMDFSPPTGLRRHARCPNCHALERHRIQFVVVNKVLREREPKNLRILHFAPESFFRDFFLQRFGRYESADLSMKDVDYNVDIQHLPFADQSYDFVFASHVLEHIPDDEKAVAEIRRILKPNGIAMLPVPIVAEKTIEYPEPNPYEEYHVRAPGMDYFERYQRHFSRVEKFTSSLLPPQYQLFVCEDRSAWPTEQSPLRLPMYGEKHVDVVPVCYV